MRARSLIVIAFLASSALAQRPVFEPDDFVDPAIHEGPLFLARLVAGGVWNPEDRFRPIHGDAGFVILTNSLHVDRFQFDYKHREAAGDDPRPLTRCDCPDPVYFPTPPPGDAMPAGPQPGRSDTLQLAFYRTSNAITLRYRLAFTRQQLDTTVTSARTGEVIEQRSGHDQSLTVDADTHFRILGRDVWGTFYIARVSRSGVPDKRAQNEVAYVWRPPGWSAKEVLFRTRLTVGGISDRGTASINLVNPYFEALWRHRDTRINFHLAWSPQATRDGEGWHTNNEIAVFADYTLFVHMFRPTR
ncbi:MAG: hypothetical protein DMF56_15930 [Acidobacteria bacterium]|nr:MAG: hypothetical protein DMF56_15930 [Acidobacteriota bacterium]